MEERIWQLCVEALRVLPRVVTKRPNLFQTWPIHTNVDI